MRVVIALGGNALLKRGEPLTAEAQSANVAVAARSIAEVAEEHDVIVTHGNGPQVGLLALQAAAFDAETPWPLDLLGAESEGMIGYVIERALINRLPDRPIATLLTQVEVAADDPAFAAPTKPIGPVYDAAARDRAVRERGWPMVADGDGWRRVVPSPKPIRILEIATLRHLVAEGVLVICAGGGGIPVIVDAGGAVHGVEAVIDKDSTAALLARDIGADALLLLTDVEAVFADWDGASPSSPIGETSLEDLSALELDPGTMGPKVAAIRRFVEETGGLAGIGRLEDAALILAGRAGTRLGAVPE
ncbi:MAG: carbamate kinase [Alphaproteobacteria bacterium]|nr:carbamate kinase [Alphaproteobacteria bacterium]